MIVTKGDGVALHNFHVAREASALWSLSPNSEAVNEPRNVILSSPGVLVFKHGIIPHIPVDLG